MTFTTEHLNVMAAWGAEVARQPNYTESPSPEDAFEALHQALSEPNARLVAAAAHVLRKLAADERTSWASLLQASPPNQVAARRLGYLAERLDDRTEDAASPLQELAHQLAFAQASPEDSELALSGLMRRRDVSRPRDAVHHRWKVLSDPDVWTAFCES